MLKDEEPVLEDKELVLEGEQRTALEAGSRERNERLRWTAAMRRMLQRSRDVRRSSARSKGETRRSEGVVEGKRKWSNTRRQRHLSGIHAESGGEIGRSG